MTDIQGIFWLAVLAAIYFLPAIVAALVKNPQAGAIFILNMLLGWTGIGWVVALVWAFVISSKRN